MKALLVASFAASLLAGCDGTAATEAQDPFGFAERIEVPQTTGALDLLGSEAPTSGERAGISYRDFDAARDAAPADAFHGFGCLVSCNGHAAGFRWARQNAVSDDFDCDGNSWSFIEGCVAFARQDDPPDTGGDERPDLGLN